MKVVLWEYGKKKKKKKYILYACIKTAVGQMNEWIFHNL